MTGNNVGNFLGGAALSRGRRETRELESRRLDIVEKQFESEQQADLLQRTREQFAGLTEQAVEMVSNMGIERDSPQFEAAIDPIRTAVATLAARAAGIFPGSVDAQNQVSLFDSAVRGAPTTLEAAQTAGAAAVAGASAQASAIQNLAPEQQEQVRLALGLQPEFTQEFFGIMAMLEDPTTTPEARAQAAKRLNFINSRSEPSQFSFSVDPEGNISVAQGPGAAEALPRRVTMNAGQLDDLRAAKDIVGRGIEISSSLTQNTDTALGALGSFRRGAQTLSGIVSDLTGIPLQELTTEFEGLLAQLPPEEREAFSVGQVDAAEGILTFAVARALQGDSNRLLASSINTAKDMVKLTGATSDEQVRDRLSFIGQFLQSQDANFQRRLEQGTSGTATTETQPAISAPAADADLINRLDSLLGTDGG